MKYLLFILASFTILSCSKNTESIDDEGDIPEWIVGKWRYTLLAHDDKFTDLIKLNEYDTLSTLEFRKNGYCYSETIHQYYTAKFTVQNSDNINTVKIQKGTIAWFETSIHISDYHLPMEVCSYNSQFISFKVIDKPNSITCYAKLKRIE